MTVFVSMSGGRSSMYMGRQLQLNDPREQIRIFANTGQEREETLRFVHECDTRWNMGIVWVEAVINERGTGTSARVVTFETASRNGEPFEAMIEKYGIPNQAFPHCTRELKLRPMYDYLKRIGAVDFKIAIGLRADEPKRLRKDAVEANIEYPLSVAGIDKIDVNDWWDAQEFNLNLKEHEGNCSWCYKKSIKKHFRLIDENPQIFQFPLRMDALHSMTNSGNGEPRVFFRGYMNTVDLFTARLMAGDMPVAPDRPDDDAGCSESCDINNEIGSTAACQ